MQNKETHAWYNYRTQQYEYLYEPPTDFHDYISQNPSAQGMYEVIIKQGQTPILAALEVLKAMVGEDCPHPPEAQVITTHQRPNDGPDEGETHLECMTCGAMLS